VADVVTTLDRLNGLTKIKYAPEIKDRIPASNKFLSRLSFLPNGNLGKKYQQTVEMVLPQGMTYAAPNAGAFDIEDMEAGQSEVAEVDANQFLFADSLDYESEAKAAKGGDAAYESAVGRVIKRAMKAFTKRVNLSFMYGGSSLALVGSMAATAGPDGDGLYSRVITVATSAWASGIWLGMKNARLDFRATDVTTGYPTATKRNAGVLKLKRISVVGETLTVRGTQADCNAIQVGDSVVFAGTYNKETMGLDRIVTNKGVLHGIDATEYEEQWAGNVYDVGGRELTLRRIYEGMGDAVGKGLEDTDVTMLLNPLSFGNLLANEAALRKHYEAQNGEAKNGFKTLKYMGQHGLIEFVPDICVKQGEAFCGPMDTMAKLGAQDITMMAPGRKKDEYWKAMEKKAGYEMRLYANLGLFCDIPGYWTKFTGITNNG
jgi:hypothetical protein